MKSRDRIIASVQKIARSRGLCGRDDDCEDVVQDVLVEVSTKYAHLPEHAQVLVAGGIAKRKLADLYRDRAMWLKHAPNLERRAEAYESLGLGSSPNSDSLNRLTVAIQTLNDEERVHMNMWARGRAAGGIGEAGGQDTRGRTNRTSASV